MRDTLRRLLFPPAPSGRLALAVLCLRVFVGMAFIQHGTGKLMHPAEFAAEFGIPVWLALVTMSTQCAGGILLIIGAFTPFAALGIAGTMIPATIFLIHRGEPFINPVGHSWENSAFYLIAGICLALSGAGRWSLDAWLWRSDRDRETGEQSRRGPSGSQKWHRPAPRNTQGQGRIESPGVNAG
jgi:putative oxidoreductase